MNDWTPVITAIAAAIPVLVVQIVLLIQASVAAARSDAHQKVIMLQNDNIIKEQNDVKVALNGSTALIPKIDKNVEDVKDIVTHRDN